MTVLEQMMAEWKPAPNSTAAKYMRDEVGITMTEDFKRILALPRRAAMAENQAKKLQLQITQAYSKPHGEQVLRSLQAQMLYEIWKYKGGFGMMPVGSGKTIPSFLAPKLLDAKIPLLLVPAQLLKKAQGKDYPELRRHWRLHPRQVFCSQEKLGVEKNKDYLFDLKPDLIVVDEAHGFKNPKAVRTKVLLRYIDSARKHNYPVTFVCLSGSMTRNSIRDYWHLITRCLPHGCPLPLRYPDMEKWSSALDSKLRNGQSRMKPGVLMNLCDPHHEPEGDLDYVRARKGYRRRLIETPGVISTTSSGFGSEEEPSLEIHEVPVADDEVPEAIKSAFFAMRNTGEMPNGDLITDSLSLWRVCSQLAFGYYTVWDWPGHAAKGLKPGEPDGEWLEKRANWHRVIRETLKNGARYKPPLDSAFQVESAYERGAFYNPYYNEWLEVRERYAEYPNKAPPTKVVWVHDFALLSAAKLLKKTGKKTIVWVSAPAVGERIAAGLKIPYFGAGNDGIMYHKGQCVASVQAHGTGKDLQWYDQNILLGSLHGNLRWQQWMGRTHRPGQKSDCVKFYLYLHAKELHNFLYKAIDEAQYYDETIGDPQKLQQATLNVKSMDEVEALTSGSRPNPLWSIVGYGKNQK